MEEDNTVAAASSPSDVDTSAPTVPRVVVVAVGSENPSKLRSVQQALERLVSRNSDNNNEITVKLFPCNVPSGVPDQPIGDVETKLGAQNRALSAQIKYKETHGELPHLAVGLEGGLEWLGEGLWCMAWMAVVGCRSARLLEYTASEDCGEFDVSDDDSSVCWGTAKTGLFALPMSVATLVKEGMELGDADDKVFSRIKSKHGSGTVGLLTDGLIDRAAYYEHALILAMVPWIRPDVYPDGVS